VTSRLACPQCGSPDQLRERALVPAVDRVTFYADGVASYDGPGAADLDWSASTTTGLECAGCDWTADGDDAVSQLIPEPELCRNCGKPVRANEDGSFMHWESGERSCYATPGEIEELEAEIARLRSNVAEIEA
jgi:hypothetical protein